MLEEIADRLETQGANPFRVRAYRKAARTVRELPDDIKPLSRAEQTERILKALDNPHVSVLAHPTGRLLGEREPCDVDLAQIVRKAKARLIRLEVNAHPERLDLTDTACRMAKDAGVLVAVSSDAHGVQEFANLRYGVGQARRGWIGPGDVLNTRWHAQLQPLLRKLRSSAHRPPRRAA